MFIHMVVNEGDCNAYARIAVNTPIKRMVYWEPLTLNPRRPKGGGGVVVTA